MANQSTFPTTLDDVPSDVTSGDVASSSDWNTYMDAIYNLETKVGVDSSAVTTSLDYRATSLEATATSHLARITAVEATAANLAPRVNTLETGKLSAFSTAPTIAATASFTQPHIVLTDTSGVYGSLGIYGTGGSKYLRMNGSGLEIINNAFDTVLVSITDAGNMGIGSSSPARTLEISNSGGNPLRLHRSGSTVGFGTVLEFALNDNNSSEQVYADMYGGITTNTSGAEDGFFAIRTVRAGTLTEAIRITKDGFFGIGTTPSYVFHVSASNSSNSGGPIATRITSTFTGSGTGACGLLVSSKSAQSASGNVNSFYGMMATSSSAPMTGYTLSSSVALYARADLSTSASGTVTNNFTFYGDTPTFGAIKPGTQYGVYVNNQGVAGVNVSYGIFVSAQSAANYPFAAYFGGTVLIAGDSSAAASTLGLTNVFSTSLSTGVGAVKLAGATSRDCNGFIKMYNGTTPIYVPYWTTITG